MNQVDANIIVRMVRESEKHLEMLLYGPEFKTYMWECVHEWRVLGPTKVNLIMQSHLGLDSAPAESNVIPIEECVLQDEDILEAIAA